VRRYESMLREALADRLPFPSKNGVPFLVERRGKSTHHLFTLHAPSDLRDGLLSKLGEKNIGVAVNYRAIHQLTYLQERLKLPRGTLPVAEEIGDRTVSLPLYPTLEASAQDRVVRAVAESLRELAS